MKVVGFHSAKETDAAVVGAVVRGAQMAGESAAVYSGEYPANVDADAVVIFGVKGRERFDEYRAAGVHVIYVDKGYDRRVEISPDGRKKKLVYWRVSIDSHHPTDLLETMSAPSDRWAALGIQTYPWRKSGKHIVLAGSSGKFHAFRGLDDPTAYAGAVARRIAELSDRTIVYRPKPSWKDAVPIPGTEFWDIEMRIEQVLTDAHALVTYGSNACFEAVVRGVPCIILGDAVARPISSTAIEDIEEPLLADDESRLRWLSNVAYTQFKVNEFADGTAWPHLRRQLR